MSSRRDIVMTQTVHQPRVAWDGARAFVQAAGSPHSEQFAARVLSRLGSEVYGQFADTRQRLLTALVETGGDRYAADVESGKWRGGPGGPARAEAGSAPAGGGPPPQ